MARSILINSNYFIFRGLARDFGFAFFVFLFFGFFHGGAISKDGGYFSYGPSCAGAQNFWNEFRSAVLEGRFDLVEKKTKFPFLIRRGVLDGESRVIKVGRKDFVKNLLISLNQDPGMSGDAETMKSYIEKRRVLSSRECLSNGLSFRVGDWVFDYGDNGWLFSMSYIN